jgi:PAS domain S-box-containing protein
MSQENVSQENERTISADRDGVIRQWGREAGNVFGYTSEEALGRQVDLIIPPVLHARHWRGFDKRAPETARQDAQGPGGAQDRRNSLDLGIAGAHASQ